MGNKADVWQGTLALMVLKTLEAMGPLHGYGMAAASSRPAAICFRSITERSIQRSLSSSRRGTSGRAGACPRTIAARSTTN